MKERKVNVAPLFDMIDKISAVCSVYEANFEHLKHVISDSLDVLSFYNGLRYCVAVLDVLRALGFLYVDQYFDLLIALSLQSGQNSPYLYDFSGNEYYLDSDARRHYTRVEG